MLKPPRTVLLFGTFDGVHAGHRDLLRQANLLGNTLVIILARDQTVMQVKGKLPKYNEVERKSRLEKEYEVTKVILGSLNDKYEAIREIQPEIIALGYDQKAFTEKLEAYVATHLPSTRIVRLQPFEPHLHKSSLLNK